MAAQGEEAVVAANLIHAQQFFPQRSQTLLDVPQRRLVGFTTIGLARRVGQCAAIELAVW